MSNGNFTETTTESWGSRLGGAFKGILVGIVLFIVATVLLFWNEGRTVKRAGSIKDAQAVTVDMPSVDAVDPNFNGKLVYTTGLAKTDEVLVDTEMGIEQNAINLQRDVEYYQWVENKKEEKKKNTGGSDTKTTTYSYEKAWTSTPVDSAGFKNSVGHQNVVNYLIESTNLAATNVTFGAYKLPEFLADSVRLNDPLIITLSDAKKAELTAAVRQAMANFPVAPATEVVDANATTTNAANSNGDLINVTENQIYIGKNEAAPTIGDVRITYTYTTNTDISVIAQVQGDTFVKYTTKNGQSYSDLSTGIESKESMFEGEKKANKTMAWILRALGIILACAGLNMVLTPLVVLADVLPILGNIAGAGTKLITGIIGVAWSLLVIAVAWVYYRPVLGISLIIIVVALIVFAVMKMKKAKKATA